MYQRTICRTERITRLQALTQKVTTVINGVPSGGTDGKSIVETATVEVHEQVDLLVIEMMNLLTVCTEIARVISAVENVEERYVLEYRYLAMYNWKEVATSLGLSLQHVYRLHGKAIESVEKILASAEK